MKPFKITESMRKTAELSTLRCRVKELEELNLENMLQRIRNLEERLEQVARDTTQLGLSR